MWWDWVLKKEADVLEVSVCVWSGLPTCVRESVYVLLRETESEMCVNVVKAVCSKQSLLGMYLSRKNVNKTFQSAQGRQPTHSKIGHFVLSLILVRRILNFSKLLSH